MNDDDLREIADSMVAHLYPVRDLVERVLTLVEDLGRRVDILELERLHERGEDTASSSTGTP